MHDRDRPTVIAVGNQKGGVGKTTVAVHLAAGLAERGHRCLLIDLDMNTGATRHFGIEPDDYLGAFEMLTGQEPIAELAIGEHDDGVIMPPRVDLVPARRNLEGIDHALAALPRRAPGDLLLGPLDAVRTDYDVVVLDTAPNATTPTVAAYQAADWFVLVAMPDPFAVACLNDALTDIADAREHANPGLRLLGVAVTGVVRRTRITRSLLGHIDHAFATAGGRSLKFQTDIARSTVVPEAQAAGSTLFGFAPGHRVTDQFRALVMEAEARLASADAHGGPSGGQAD